jgi:hypothetical protein
VARPQLRKEAVQLTSAFGFAHAVGITDDAGADPTGVQQLRALLSRYRDLRRMPTAQAQRRGEEFNRLIADLLTSGGLTARSSVRGLGGRDETDVAFTADGIHYILEAKWETPAIDEGPVAKIAERLDDRPAGTRAILLSMSGFTAHVLERAKLKPKVLLLNGDHLEAMLCGLLAPDEMLRLLYAHTAARGGAYVELGELLVSEQQSAPELKAAADGEPWQVFDEADNGVVATPRWTGSWPTDCHPTGMTRAPRKRLLITTAAGVVEFHPATTRTKWALPMGGCEGPAFRAEDKSLVALSNGAVVHWQPTTRKLTLLAGGFRGYAELIRTDSGQFWVYCQYGSVQSGSVTLTRLGRQPGDEERHDLLFPATSRAVWLEAERFFLSGSGSSTVVDLAGAPADGQEGWFESAVPDPRADVALDSGTVLTGGVRQSLEGFVHAFDVGAGTYREVFRITVNRITDQVLENLSSSAATVYLLADVRGNAMNPHPLLLQVTLPEIALAP